MPSGVEAPPVRRQTSSASAAIGAASTLASSIASTPSATAARLAVGAEQAESPVGRVETLDAPPRSHADRRAAAGRRSDTVVPIAELRRGPGAPSVVAAFGLATVSRCSRRRRGPPGATRRTPRWCTSPPTRRRSRRSAPAAPRSAGSARPRSRSGPDRPPDGSSSAVTSVTCAVARSSPTPGRGRSGCRPPGRRASRRPPRRRSGAVVRVPPAAESPLRSRWTGRTGGRRRRSRSSPCGSAGSTVATVGRRLEVQQQDEGEGGQPEGEGAAFRHLTWSPSVSRGVRRPTARIRRDEGR